MPNIQQAKIITPQDFSAVRAPLPKSFLAAAGMLRGKKRVEPLAYQKLLRREWEKRFKRLIASPRL